MKTRNIIILDHRARCSRCGGKASHYTTIPGIGYSYPPYISGWNKAAYDLSRKDEDREIPYPKLLRENSVRGSMSNNPFFFKTNKKNWGSYRVLVSCKCGESTWMFQGPTSDPNVLNRTLSGSLENYSVRYYLPSANIKF